MHPARLTTASDARQFILAGNATVTLVSVKTGTRFTYSIRVSEDGQVHFVALLNGPDNESDFKYLGLIRRDIFWPGRKHPKPGDVGRDAPSMQAFDWAWRRLVKNQTLPPDLVEIWHEGRCGRCNRKLTVPSSIASGFGPECVGKLGFVAEEV
jgi:hypothetical protein